MRAAKNISVPVVALALLLIFLALPRYGHGQSDSSRDLGKYIVHYSAISTNQLLPAMAKRYAIARDANHGLLNIAIEEKGGGSRMVRADVSARVGDLLGHDQPIPMRETSEAGEIDYLGVFELNGSGTYHFTVRVTLPGATQPNVVKFNRDYVVD